MLSFQINLPVVTGLQFDKEIVELINEQGYHTLSSILSNCKGALVNM